MSRHVVAGALMMALSIQGAGLGAQATPMASADLLYVCIQDDAKVAVVDMGSGELLRIIDLQTLGFSATAKPHYVAVEPGGEHWYVSLIGENRVLKLDRSDRVVASYETQVPGILRLTRDAAQLVVSRSMSAVNPPSQVAVINTGDMEGDEVGVFFPRPHAVAVSAEGFAYTASLGVNQIASIDIDAERVELVDVEGDPHSFVQFELSPDGSTLVGTTERSGLLIAWSLENPAMPERIASVELGPMAFHPVYTRDGRFIYVPIKGSNEIAVVETDGWTVVRRISSPAFKQPHQLVFSADGSKAFLSNNNKGMMDMPEMPGHDMGAESGPASLVVLDVATGQVSRTIELGMYLTGMGSRAPR